MVGNLTFDPSIIKSLELLNLDWWLRFILWKSTRLRQHAKCMQHLLPICTKVTFCFCLISLEMSKLKGHPTFCSTAKIMALNLKNIAPTLTLDQQTVILFGKDLSHDPPTNQFWRSDGLCRPGAWLSVKCVLLCPQAPIACGLWDCFLLCLQHRWKVPTRLRKSLPS